MTLKNNRAPVLYYFKLCASSKTLQWIKTEVAVWKCSILVKISNFLSHMTLKFDGRPRKTNLQCHFKLCASFQSHWWIQTGVTFQKHSKFEWKFAIFLSRVTLKLKGWLWKTKDYLFYATSSFAHHFLTIGVFKLESQSGNAQFGS